MIMLRKLEDNLKPWESFEKVEEKLEVFSTIPSFNGYSFRLIPEHSIATEKHIYEVIKESESEFVQPISFDQRIFEGYIFTLLKINLADTQSKKLLELDYIKSKLTIPMLEELGRITVPATLSLRTTHNGARKIQANSINFSDSREPICFSYKGLFNSKNIEINTRHLCDAISDCYCSVRDTNNEVGLVFTPLRTKSGERINLENLEKNDPCLEVKYFGDMSKAQELYQLLTPSIQVRSGSFAFSICRENMFLSLTTLEQYLSPTINGKKPNKKISLHFSDKELLEYLHLKGYKLTNNRPFFF